MIKIKKYFLFGLIIFCLLFVGGTRIIQADNSEPVDAKTKITASGEYSLLAPLGDSLKTINTNNIADYFNIMIEILIGLCAALAVIMIVISGIEYMGTDSIFTKGEAKKRMGMAVLGLLIALGSYAILNTINPDLLKTKLNIGKVAFVVDDETEGEPWEGYSPTGGNIELCKEGFVNVETYGDGSYRKQKYINVCKSISDNLRKLLETAKQDGLIISGSGSRTTEEQRAMRIKNGCADDSLPSSACTPHTARPGHSMHESGLAVDFNCNGGTMRNSPCYRWLSKHASRFGFYNLKSEPWHWSVNGR